MVELVDLLLKLAEFSIIRVGKALEDGRVKFRIIPRIRETRRVAQGNFTQISSTKVEQVQSAIFHPDDLKNLFGTEIKSAKEYQDIQEFIQSNNREYLENLEEYSFHFFAAVVHNHFWNVPPNPVEDIIDAFLNDLFHKTIPSIITIWLTGLRLESDFQCQNTTIKTPSEEDLMIERGVAEPAFWLRNAHRIVPTAILKTMFVPNEQYREAYEYVSRLLTSLKLFRSGIEEVMVFRNPASLISTPQKSENHEAHERGRRLITKNDFDELEYHITSLPQMIPKTILEGPYRQDTRLAVAYQCYANAVYIFVAPNEVLTEAIRGIESLYLGLDKRPGKGLRLGKRVSTVLSNDGLEAQEIKTNIKKAYIDIRNPTSHGTPVDTKKQFSVMEHIPVLIEYLRTSILILIKDGKESFLDRFYGT